jgi:hypothetical protein
MTIRESGLATGIGWAVALWACLYTIDLAARADQVTSKQWQYLMSVPGGQWSWTALFGMGGLLLLVGMLTRLYRLRAVGCAILGTGALTIAAFYWCAPTIDPGLTTLGYHPWYAWGIVLMFCAAVNWRPVAWF